MNLTDVENLLAERLGFDIHSIGQKAVETVVTRSMKESGFSDPDAYARMLLVIRTRGIPLSIRW